MKYCKTKPSMRWTVHVIRMTGMRSNYCTLFSLHVCSNIKKEVVNSARSDRKCHSTIPM